MDQLQLTVPEILSLIGVAQCLYVLVYIAMRAGRISRAGIAILYFYALGLGFLSDFSAGYIGGIWPYYDDMSWFAWFYGPPLSVLLVIQIAQITKTPHLRHYWVIFLTPAAYVASSYLAQRTAAEFDELLIVSGLVAGAISLLAIWANRGLFDEILAQKTGKERYWLIIALLLMNISFLGLMLMGLNENMTEDDVRLMRTFLGLGFVYLVNTSLFRIYPRAVHIESQVREDLSPQEAEIAGKIERLMMLEKVYQEPTYSRTDLARECHASEAVISKIINTHFGKTFPQLVNELRIKDAKQLLLETDAAVRVIANDVGFNSLASFNRVFKDSTGFSPSQFRKTRAGNTK